VATAEMDSETYTFSEDDNTAVVEVKLNTAVPIARSLSFRYDFRCFKFSRDE
jgi:hypothetical protein